MSRLILSPDGVVWARFTETVSNPNRNNKLPKGSTWLPRTMKEVLSFIYDVDAQEFTKDRSGFQDIPEDIENLPFCAVAMRLVAPPPGSGISRMFSACGIVGENRRVYATRSSFTPAHVLKAMDFTIFQRQIERQRILWNERESPFWGLPALNPGTFRIHAS